MIIIFDFFIQYHNYIDIYQLIIKSSENSINMYIEKNHGKMDSIKKSYR